MSDKQEKKKPEIDVKEIEQDYLSIRPIAESFCTEVTHQLETLLGEAGITIGFPIQNRVKTWESISEKLKRLPSRFKKVTDLQDLVGLRLILLFKRDIPKTCDLISNKFSVIRRYDTQERLGADQFGYSSIHFVINLPQEWLSVPTFSKMGNIIAEIQVRTLAQHMWAETSHKLQYKSEENVPPTIRRAIYRVSALLETVDLEFERVLTERDIYREEQTTFLADDHLNVDLLEKTLDSLFPPSNKLDDEPYAEILKELGYFGIKRQKDLVELIKKHVEKIVQDDKKQVKKYRLRLKNGQAMFGTSPERLEKGIFFTYLGFIRGIIKYEFGAKADRFYFDTGVYIGATE
jgi:putative GTP pyrophosphokinase